MKKEELIEFIMQKSDFSHEELKGKKISELKTICSNFTEAVASPDSGISDTDPEWSDYVMSNFVESEMKEGMPTCDGLRRVFKKLVGEITSCYMDVLKPPTALDPTSTVSCQINFTKKGSIKNYSISDVFDVNNENTPWPYCKASAATAATKAEARALRKGLGLVKIYSAEEVHEAIDVSDISMNQIDGSKQISDSAKIAINTMSNRLGISPSKLISHLGIDKADVSSLSYTEGHAILAKLNAFTRGENNGGENVPAEIKTTEMVF